MIKLVQLELKKIGVIKILTVFIILSLPLIYINMIVGGSRTNYEEWIKPERAYFDTVKGYITEEKYNSINNELEKIKNGAGGKIDENGIEINNDSEYEAYLDSPGKYCKTVRADISMLESVLQYCDDFIKVEKNRRIIIENAQSNLAKLGNDNSYEAKYNRIVLDKATNLSELKLTDRHSMYSSFFESREYVFIMIVAIIVLLSGMFTKEKEQGMMSLLQTTKGGRRKLFCVKYITMLIVGLMTTVYFHIVEFFSLAYTWGINDITFSIRSIRGFEYSLYDFSIFKGIILTILIRFLVLALVGSVIMLLSILTKNTILSMGLSMAFVGAGVGIPYAVRAQAMSFSASFLMAQRYEKMKISACTMALWASDYFKEYDMVNVLGHPVTEKTCICIVCLLSFVIVTAVSFVIACETTKDGRFTTLLRRARPFGPGKVRY